MFNFLIIVLILSIFLLFYGGVTIFSTILQFSSGIGFGFINYSVILFPILFPLSPVASAVLWTTFFKADFTAFHPVFVAAANIFFLYL